MPRVRIGAAYTTGNNTGVALHQEGNKVALQEYSAHTAGAAFTPTDTILVEKKASDLDLVYAGEQTSHMRTCTCAQSKCESAFRECARACKLLTSSL
eukprot:scaffold5340_cov131-Isochrysis_galbana.AAC.5